MPVISLGADSSAFLQAATQAQQAAKQLTAAALEAQRAVQVLTQKTNYDKFIAESDKAAGTVDRLRASTVKAADGTSEALHRINAGIQSTNEVLREPWSFASFEGIIENAAAVTVGLSDMGAEAQSTFSVVSDMAEDVDKTQQAALGSLLGYTIQLGATTVRTRELGESLADGFINVDRNLEDCFEKMLTGAEVSFDGIRKAFVSMLADMTNMTLLRPITISVFGALGGILGQDGTVELVDSEGNPVNNPSLANGSSFVPNSFYSDISNTINETMASWFPGTFGNGVAITAPSLSGVSFLGSSAVSAGGYAGLGGVSFMNGTAGAMNALPAGAAGWSSGMGLGSAGVSAPATGLSTFTSTITPYLGAAGLGSMGYQMLGGMIGLPQSKYSGLTSALGSAAGWGLGSLAAGSSLATGTSLATGMAFGSVIPVIGTILGALGGGLLGSLFGAERKTRPSVYTLSNNMPIDSDYDYTKAFMDGAWYDRAGSKEAEKIMPILGDAAKVAAQQVEALVAALPEEFRGQVEAEIAASSFSAGRGVPGMDKHNWNFQFYDEEQLKERLEAVVKDIQVAIGKTAQEAMANVDISSMYNFDLSSSEGMDKAVKAVTAVKDITEATKEIAEPTSQFVEQAKAAKKQMDAWATSMEEYGVVAEYAAEVVDGYRQANIDAALGNIADATKALTEPTSQFVVQARAAKKQMEDWIAGMKEYGADDDTVTAAVDSYKQANIDVAMGNILEATKALVQPTSELVVQARAAKKQMDEWIEGMAEYGASMDEVNAAVDEYRRTVIKANIDALESSISPLSAYEQAVNAANKAVDDRKAALLELGASEEDLARVEGLRAGVLESMTAAMRNSFDQDLRLRQAQLAGNAEAIAATQLTIQHERELADVRAKFGENSVQYAKIQYMQIAEAAQLAWQQQQAAAQKMLQQQANAAQAALTEANKDAAEANAALSKAQSNLNAVRSAYLSALNKEAGALQSTVDSVSRAVEQLSRTRRDLLTSDASPLGTDERYALTGAELERTFNKAMSGDVEAMADLSRLSSQYLDVSKEANADFSKYRKDFDKVQAMLAAVETSGLSQIDTAQKQLDLLNAQIAAATEGTGQIVGSIKELEAAFVAALGDYTNAQEEAARAQEAARKAQEAADEARRKAEEAADKAQQDSQQSAPKTWMQEVLERKAAAMNRGETLTPGQTAGGWTVDRVLQSILAAGESFESWYAKYGRLEGFAKGGLASGWALVGEEGPELVNFSNPGRVYTADDTADMLNPRSDFSRPTVSGQSETNALLQEIRALRREVSELRAEQSRSQFSIADAAQRTARKLEQFDYDGLPGVRAQ